MVIKWKCTCGVGGSGYPNAYECEQAQIRHAEARHKHHLGYTVASRGRVIWRAR